MKKDEYERLEDELGEKGALACIEILGNYKASSGRNYKSDYHAVKSWVISVYRKNGGKDSNKQRSFGEEALEMLGDFCPPP